MLNICKGPCVGTSLRAPSVPTTAVTGLLGQRSHDFNFTFFLFCSALSTSHHIAIPTSRNAGGSGCSEICDPNNFSSCVELPARCICNISRLCHFVVPDTFAESFVFLSLPTLRCAPYKYIKFIICANANIDYTPSALPGPCNPNPCPSGTYLRLLFPLCGNFLCVTTYTIHVTLGTACEPTNQVCTTYPCQQYRCRGPDPAVCFDTRQGPVCPVGTTCVPEPKNCFMPPCHQYRCDPQGVIIPQNCKCSDNYRPVCVNGIQTLRNPCEAHCSGLTSYTPGQCFSNFGDGMGPTYALGGGSGCSCGNQFEPVCAGGVTHPNQCQASCKGFQTWTNGVCQRTLQQSSCSCPYQSIPVCANGITYLNACEAQCQGVLTYSQGACGGGDGTDPNSKCGCSDIYSPVCGQNGVTYRNLCEAACNGVTNYNPGSCPNDQIPLGCDCPEQRIPVCSNGITYQNMCVASCQGADPSTIVQGVCQGFQARPAQILPPPCNCPTERAGPPVCANSVTYPNACEANCRGFNKYTSGACPEKGTCRGICGGTAATGCYCDGECYKNADCCRDYEQFCSCRGQCSQQRSRDKCQCDQDCEQNGNCCGDYKAECTQEVTGSCNGKCSSTDVNPGDCYCDASCATSNDCCPDYNNYCARNFARSADPSAAASVVGNAQLYFYVSHS